MSFIKSHRTWVVGGIVGVAGLVALGSLFSGSDEPKTARDSSAEKATEGDSRSASDESPRAGKARRLSANVPPARQGTPEASIEEQREAWLQKRYSRDVTEGEDGSRAEPRPPRRPKAEPRPATPVTQDQLKAAQTRILAQMPEERAAFDEINANVARELEKQDQPLPRGYPPVHPVGEGPNIPPLEGR